MKIKILGTGCKKCQALTANAQAAADAAGIQVEIEKVTDFVTIAGFGVMATPGLVIDEKVAASGRVLSAEEIRPLLEKA